MNDRQEVRGSPRVSVVIGGFLLIQLLLPLRGFVSDGHDTRGNFSWNMLGQRIECQNSYLASFADGPVVEVDHRHFFHRGLRYELVFQRDVLPRYHAYLCEELRTRGELIRLDGICLCSHVTGELEPLIRDDVDLCTEPNYGVIER